MLKLTRSPENAPVYISPVHICAICPYSSGNTEIRFPGGTYLVKETPEEILAMPAMVYFMNPAMVLKP